MVSSREGVTSAVFVSKHLTHFNLASSPEEMNDLITKELSSTMTALKTHPKVYWIWNHRRWCLENTPNKPTTPGQSDADLWIKTNWDRELHVVEILLDADPRNCRSILLSYHIHPQLIFGQTVHAWNYRRYVLASMPRPRTEKSELVYTSRKIGANISNFSAWHQRSKVLTSLGAIGTVTSNYREEGNCFRCDFYFRPMETDMQNLKSCEMPCTRIQVIRASGCTIDGSWVQASKLCLFLNVHFKITMAP